MHSVFDDDVHRRAVPERLQRIVGRHMHNLPDDVPRRTVPERLQRIVGRHVPPSFVSPLSPAPICPLLPSFLSSFPHSLNKLYHGKAKAKSQSRANWPRVSDKDGPGPAVPGKWRGGTLAEAASSISSRLSELKPRGPRPQCPSFPTAACSQKR